MAQMRTALFVLSHKKEAVDFLDLGPRASKKVEHWRARLLRKTEKIDSSQGERLAIEDYFFSQDVKTTLDPATTAVVVSQSLTPKATMEEFAILIEFALGILAVSGFQSVGIVATFNSLNCSEALQRSNKAATDAATFPRRVRKAAASAWIRRFFAARLHTKDRMHITADRFVRYSRTKSSPDSFLDLCICLESLLDSQTEISFRFGTCLSKVMGGTGTEAEELSDLLSDLYDLRSKVVHGTEATKEHKKIDPHVVRLHQVARRILTTYVLYMSEHTRDEWKKHLRSSIFK